MNNSHISDRVGRRLRLLTWSSVPIAAATLLGVALDDRVLGGERIWVKPFKFAVSIGLTGVATTWLRDRLVVAADQAGVEAGSKAAKVRRRVDRAALAVVLTLAAEQVLITIQAARGIRSHFNQDTAFDGMVFSTMGGLISVTFGALVVMALVGRSHRSRDRIADHVARHGISLVILGSAVGFVMVAANAHSIGGPDGGAGLPLVHWNTEIGDLRPGHFVGLHGLQVLILVAALLGRARWSEPAVTRAVDAVAGATAVATVALTAQALAGRPITSASSIAVAVASLAGAGVAAAVSARRIGFRPELIDAVTTPARDEAPVAS